MTLALLVIVFLTLVTTLPAWQLERRKGRDSPLVLGLALPAAVAWLGLTIGGFGAQSLSNVVELLALLAAGVVLAYVHLGLVSRADVSPRATAIWMMVGLTLLAVVLRSFMPVLPE